MVLPIVFSFVQQTVVVHFCGTSGHPKVKNIASTFLPLWISLDTEPLVDEVEQPNYDAICVALDPIIAVLRCTSALQNKVPGKYGADHTHVTWIFPQTPEERKNCFRNTDSKHGGRIANELSRGHCWTTWLAEFRDKVGGEAACTEPIKIFYNKTVEVVDELDTQDTVGDDSGHTLESLAPLQALFDPPGSTTESGLTVHISQINK